MHYELSFKMIERDYKAFLQDGFYVSPKTDTSLHRHNYAEVHVLGEGKAEFLIDNHTLTVNGPAILTIPAPMMHCCTYQDENLMHTAFQTDCQADQLCIYPLESGIAKAFFQEIEKCQLTGNYTTIALYISLICNCYHKEHLSVTEIKDYNFLISEFSFSTTTKMSIFPILQSNCIFPSATPNALSCNIRDIAFAKNSSPFVCVLQTN